MREGVDMFNIYNKKTRKTIVSVVAIILAISMVIPCLVYLF
jgi:hypothetical protein